MAEGAPAAMEISAPLSQPENTEWFGLEDLKTISFQFPAMCNLPPDQAPQSSVKPDLEHFQGWASTTSLGKHKIYL